MSAFFEALGRPEYIHVLLNPLPVYGLAAGILGLALALIVRQSAALRVCLVVVAVMSASAFPVLRSGEAAYEGTRVTLDVDGQAWLDAHLHRAQRLVWAFYATAAIAVAAVLLPLRWPKALVPLSILTLLMALGAMTAGGWISYAGGRVRHREFRTEAPPS
jgi:hypothetical protein